MEGILTTEKDLWKLLHSAPGMDKESTELLGKITLATLPLELDLSRGKEEFLEGLRKVVQDSNDS